MTVIEVIDSLWSFKRGGLCTQVSVQCIERGSLLAEVRDRYSKLLSRVPRQIKGYVVCW